MNILFVDTYYPRFLDTLYRGTGLAKRSYEEQRQVLISSNFGTADYYSRHLIDLGHETHDIIANCTPLQARWAVENGIKVNPLAVRLAPRWQRVRFIGKRIASTRGLLSIVCKQIRKRKPDVLYLQDLSLIPPDILASLKSDVGLVVGQIACPFPPSGYLDPYDLILTSFLHYVSRIRDIGIASEYFRIAFDPSVLKNLGNTKKCYECTFVGGISPAHKKGKDLLEYVVRNIETDFFGYGKRKLGLFSAIRKRHHGEVWGIDMYRALAQSKITINRHIDVAENYANNMRLYEATGCGAMLLTDEKDNLGELFDIGKEVVTYHSAADAVEKIQYYTAHPKERDAIARAGQRRTLCDHTYANRMGELVGILERYLRR